MTDNQFKWILRLGAECGREEGKFLGWILIALQHNLLPDTEPTFNGEDIETVMEIIELAKDPEKVKVIAEIIKKMDKKEEEFINE